MPEEAPSLRFRGGMAVGDIRPVWQEIAGARQAAWVEAGANNPFVESARLMELERKVEDNKSRSLVVLSEELAGKLDSKTVRWFRQGLELSGKHGVRYRLAVYAPAPAEGEPRAKARRAS
jgi:hypothetical protein